jgi:signal transduction histidine kinase
MIMGYPDELNQVWTNLIYNAMQAMDFKGVLEIDIEEISQEVVVSVKDTGSGISPENQVKVFQTFFTTKPAGEGTGLGLSITKKIVEKHNGRISFESEVGKGTTFKVFLPI